MFAIGSEVVDASEKLSDDLADNPQSFCFSNATVELTEHGSELGPIGELESSARQLVKLLAQRSAVQPPISSASAVL